MKPEPPLLNRDRLRKLGVVVGVTLAHLGVFSIMARADAPLPAPGAPPVVSVFLYRPAPPPPPPPVEPARTQGGGAPAAPSRIHVPPKPADKPREVIAPPVPAPEPTVVVGAAPVATPTPGLGQGGEGTGTGTGQGSGSGPGSGGTRWRLVAGASSAEIQRAYPPAARRARIGGNVLLSCRIRLDRRLENCRVVRETPSGQGFGAAALTTVVHFRAAPPTEGGRPVENAEATFGVVFGP
ncbi:MAG: TonB family protein [Brevundimonas sp.]